MLRIHNVVLVPAPSRLPTPSSPPQLVELQLIDIHTLETFADILGALRDIPELFFTRCAIGDPGVPFGGESGDLTLEGIDAEQNLIPLLRRWEGNSLRIVNCPSFDEAVLLDIMACNNACAARNLATLHIDDSDNFSGASLRRLINARRVVGRDITELNLSGRVPEISAEDQEWLSQTLDQFEYEP
jgi:hypothetical protein